MNPLVCSFWISVHMCSWAYECDEHDEYPRVYVSRTLLILLARFCMSFVVSSHALVQRVACLALWLALIDSALPRPLVKRRISLKRAQHSNLGTVRFQPWSLFQYALYFIPFLFLHSYHAFMCFLFFHSFLKFINKWWMIQMAWEFLHCAPHCV